MAWFPRFTAKQKHRRLSTCATTMRVRYVYERRRCATKVKMRHASATLNSNIFIVYGQKHKLWVLVFLVRNKRNILRPKLSRFGEIFCFASKPHRLQQLHSRNAAKWLGNKTDNACMFVVKSKLLPRPDALLHSASCKSASGRPRHLRVIVWTILQT